MTNNNYPDDRLPEDENLGTAGTPRSSGRELHTHSSSFEPTEHEHAPASCEICGCSIPPTDARCRDHQVKNGTEKRDTDHEWKYSHVAVAVVPANSKLHALALASAAFKHRDNVPGDGRSFELIETMEDPSSTITSDWGGNLPEAATLDSPSGESLIHTAISAAESDTTPTDTHPTGVDFDRFADSHPSENIFLEDGTTIQPTAAEEIEIQDPEDTEKDVWVVPALLFRRSYNTNDNPVRFRDCTNCGTPRKHVFDGVEQHQEHHERTGRWVCLSCGTPTYGSLPSTEIKQNAPLVFEPTKEHLDRQQHESMMSNLEKKGEFE